MLAYWPKPDNVLAWLLRACHLRGISDDGDENHSDCIGNVVSAVAEDVLYVNQSNEVEDQSNQIEQISFSIQKDENWCYVHSEGKVVPELANF